MPFNFGNRGDASVSGGTFNDVAGNQTNNHRTNNTNNTNSHNKTNTANATSNTNTHNERNGFKTTTTNRDNSVFHLFPSVRKGRIIQQFIVTANNSSVRRGSPATSGRK
uniref:Uncharacterized protein n=1 Tax=Moniliophthora roreri TaxID=221103 RepID=A0A0W0G7L2_MONRR